VLDVEHVERWAPKLGGQVTSLAITGGMHDLFLSAEPVRDKAFAAIDEFLDR
jgi:alpha-beta hydrolase superfamily lysophospholipase